MISKKIIIVGGNAAGPSAAAKAKRVNPNAEIIMFEAGEFISTGTCELPYLISGDIGDYKKIVFFDENSFLEKKGVKVYTKHIVQSIDKQRKSISVKNLIDGSEHEFRYDKLVLCTGSKSKKIPIFNENIENVFYLKTVSNYIKINDYLRANNVKNVLIIGASFIGLEVADAFKVAGKNVVLLDSQKHPMPTSEREVQQLINETLKNNNVEFIGNGSTANYFVEGNRVKGFEFGGKTKEIDLVIVSIGFAPEVSLAEQTNLKLGAFGAIKVDAQQRTSDPNIFAAGDNCEVINKVTNRPDYMPIATFAHQQGHIAGANAAGAFENLKPVVKNTAVKIFDKTLASVGLISNEAENLGFSSKSVVANAYSIISVMPNSGKVFGKILYNPSTKLIYGASFYGKEEVTGYADIISSFIQNRISGDKLSEISFNYTPPRSPFIHLLSILGKEIKKG